MTIDLRSDTVTRPTPAMRRAMAEAEVGDDDRDGDPTTRRLEARVAELLGKEGALFFPSGSMANQSAVWLHSRPGTEILLDADAHIVHFESAGAAALAGVQLRLVRNAVAGGVIDAASLTTSIRKRSRDVPVPTLVCAENTHNGAGGKITPLAGLRAIRDVATAHALPVHLDGARLWNASAASGTSLADFAACADTVMLSFSKGLGCPIGATLVGSKSVIDEAWSVRKRFGGSLRQSGILTAAALYALDHHLSRLPEDHAHAASFAKRVDGAAGVRVVPPDTNIVMLDLAPGMAVGPVIAAAAEQGVRLGEWTPTRLRAVFHLDVDTTATTRAGDVVVAALERSTRH